MKKGRKVISSIQKQHNINTFGEVLNEIVKEYMKETGFHVEIVIKIVGKYFNITTEEVKIELKRINSKFTTNNYYAVFENGRFLKRTALQMRFKRVIDKIESGIDDIKDIDKEELMGYIEGILTDTCKGQNYVRTNKVEEVYRIPKEYMGVYNNE